MPIPVDVFLADPIITDVNLPPFKRERMRYVYRLELSHCTADQEILAETFRILNIGHPADYNERSLSVGDVVKLAVPHERIGVLAIVPCGKTKIWSRNFLAGPTPAKDRLCIPAFQIASPLCGIIRCRLAGPLCLVRFPSPGAIDRGLRSEVFPLRSGLSKLVASPRALSAGPEIASI